MGEGEGENEGEGEAEAEGETEGTGTGEEYVDDGGGEMDGFFCPPLPIRIFVFICRSTTVGSLRMGRDGLGVEERAWMAAVEGTMARAG